MFCHAFRTPLFSQLTEYGRRHINSQFPWRLLWLVEVLSWKRIPSNSDSRELGLISVPPHNHRSMQISLEKTAFSHSPSVLCRLLMVLPSSLCCLTLIVESSLSSHLGIQVTRCMRVIPLSLPLPSLPPCCLSCHSAVRICLPRSLKVDKASKCWRCTTTLWGTIQKSLLLDCLPTLWDM